jgi:aspartate carbamoyltransferase regulatory subunit
MMESHVNLVHKKVHPYVCEICSRQYASKNAHRVHNQMCHGENSAEIKRKMSIRDKKRLSAMVMCDFCGTQMTKSSLRIHKLKSVRFVSVFFLVSCPEF